MIEHELTISDIESGNIPKLKLGDIVKISRNYSVYTFRVLEHPYMGNICLLSYDWDYGYDTSQRGIEDTNNYVKCSNITAINLEGTAEELRKKLMNLWYKLE